MMRSQVVAWLRELKKQESSDPCLVAVEWGRDAHAQVFAEREMLKDAIRQKWPGISEELLTTLGDAMAFEGDAHRAVWTALEPIWLDDMRTLSFKDQYNLDNYAEGRFEIYVARLRGIDPVRDPEGALKQLTEQAHAGQSGWGANSRDESWAEQIVNGITKDCAWAVVIAGAEHFAPDHAGNVRGRLDRDGTCANIAGPGRLLRRVITI